MKSNATGPTVEDIESAREKYVLPETQQPDGELDESEMVAYDNAKELSEQFDAIKTQTLGDGIVRGTVTAIETTTHNQKIVIDVTVPAETDPVRFYMWKPKVWDETYEFVRWLHKYGYSAEDFAGMIEKGIEVEVRRDDDEYELVVPRRRRSFRAIIRDGVNALHGQITTTEQFEYTWEIVWVFAGMFFGIYVPLNKTVAEGALQTTVASFSGAILGALLFGFIGLYVLVIFGVVE